MSQLTFTVWGKKIPGISYVLPMLFFLCMAMSVTSFATEMAGPIVALPEDVRVFDAGENVSFNGIPVRMQAFVSDRSPDQLAQWFHQKMGEPLMDDRIGKKRVLGRLQGDTYITVQFEAEGKGSHGLVAVTQTSAISLNQKKNEELNQHWLTKMPPGSRLLQQVLSKDGKRYSTHLTFTNTYSVGVNRDAVLRALKNEGYQLEEGQATKGSEFASGSPQALYFNGKNKQAIALIKHAETGSSVVILNLVSVLEKVQ